MKIDTKSIDGYETMSPEEKLAALERLDIPGPDMSGYVSKDTADKYAREAADLKKQLRERMSNEEAERAQQAEQQAQMQAELEQLRRERAVDRNRSALLELGWDGKLALQTAEAMAAGEMGKVFDALSKFQSEFEKRIKGELLKGTQRPPAGDAPKGMTRDQFRKMSLAEKAQLAQEQPEIYAQMINGGS